ncbi:type I secretion system permease/ATPase [Thiomicrospira microaerophila]|nr:type I secretion system permease/ATPase [Thiomicrospira microaerophila]
MAISKQFNRSVSPESLIAGLPLENNQLNPSNFSRAAKRAGLASKVVTKHFSQVNEALLPAIILLKNNQACLLEKIDHEKKEVIVVLPELIDTPVITSFEDLEQNYAGIIIYCRPEFKFDKTSPTLNKKRSGHWFWSVIKENRRVYRDVIIAAIIINLFAVAMPLFVMNVYDRVVPNHATETLWVLASGITLVIIADLLLKLMRSWFIDLAASRSDVKLSASIMEKILGMQMRDRPQSSGSFASTIQSFESVRSFTSSLTLISMVDFPFILLFLLIIALINPILTIPIIIGAIIIILYAMAMQSKMQQLSEESMRASAMRNGSLVENISNLETLKALGTQNKAQSIWENATIFLTRTSAKMRFISAAVSNGAQSIQHLVAVVVVIIGVYLIIEGEISQGGLIAAYLLSSRAISPVSQAAGLINQYNNAARALEALDTIMQRTTERPEDQTWIEPGIIKGDIEFKNVSFKYTDESNLALNNASFKIKPGEHLAIIGRNGSGKTTVEKLILGFYHAESGSILIDGLDIKQIDPNVLRRNIGYIPQEVALFYGSLKDNILASKPDATDDELIKAIKIAGLESLINTHPHGINMQVGERGQLLSGGQRQAVALARAVINDPPILLLDEPTASLDHTSEVLIMHNLAEYAKNKTMLMITHRTSLLQLAEKLVVIDAGKVVANGPKAEVLEALRQGKIGAAN